MGEGSISGRVAAALTILTMVALMAFSGASPAAGAIALRPYSASATHLFTDGVRWAWFEPKTGVTRTVDTQTGKQVDRPDPEGCDRLEAVGGGELLYACLPIGCPPPFDHTGCVLSRRPEAEWVDRRYVVQDAATGAQHPVIGADHLPTLGYGSGLQAIGSEWAEGEFGAYHARDVYFLNWHTGSFARSEPGSAASAYENLSDVALLSPLCSPLRRGPNRSFFGEGGRFNSVAYAWPFMAERSSEDLQHPFELRRCGSGRHDDLPAGREVAFDQIGGGILSWVDREGVMRVTRLRPRGRRWYGAISRVRGLRSNQEVELTHTTRTLFETVPGSGGGYSIYAGLLSAKM